MYVKNNDRLLTIQRRFNLNEVIVYLLQNWQVYDQVKRENLLFRHEKQSWKRWGRGVSLNVSMTDGWELSFWQHLSFLQGRVHVFVLLKLLQLGLDQNLSDVHHLLHGESQALHRVTELLLRGKRHHHHQPATSCASGQGMQTVATTSEMNEICSQGDKHQVNMVMIKSPKIQPDRVRQLKKMSYRHQACREVMEVKTAAFNSAVDAVHNHDDPDDVKMHVNATHPLRWWCAAFGLVSLFSRSINPFCTPAAQWLVYKYWGANFLQYF